MKHTDSSSKTLAQVLYDCAAACNECASACLEEKDIDMLRRCIRLDIDCAQLCGLTASFVARKSPHAILLMDECAEICNVCATECEKHHHMEHCRHCAEVCRHCAEICSELVVTG